MEAIISDLLNRLERGALTRRGFIQGIAMLTASGTASLGHAQNAAVQNPAQDTAAQGTPIQNSGIQGVKIDHVSIQVSDLPRSLAFYQKTFGLKILTEDKPHEIVRLGTGQFIVSLHHKSPTGLVDHFAIGVENFNKERVTQQLQQVGVTPEENFDAGFYVTDPEGMSVQIVPA
jgi:catechol 2,3-dioxygenase-like lactoylglutathione lyase family enzyme